MPTQKLQIDQSLNRRNDTAFLQILNNNKIKSSPAQTSLLIDILVAPPPTPPNHPDIKPSMRISNDLAILQIIDRNNRENPKHSPIKFYGRFTKNAACQSIAAISTRGGAGSAAFRQACVIPVTLSYPARCIGMWTWPMRWSLKTSFFLKILMPRLRLLHIKHHA